MKLLLRSSLLVVVAFACAFTVGKSFWTWRLLAQSSTTTAFTMVRVASAEGGVTKTETVATRSDFARSVMSAFSKYAPSDYVRRITFPDGRFYVVFDALRSQSSGKYPLQRVQSMLRQGPIPSDCVIPQSMEIKVDEEMILNRHTIKISRTDALGKSGDFLRLTHWRDPELRCEPLQILLERMSSTGTVTEVSRDVVVKLTIGDPDGKLFDIPTGYEELAPSEIDKRWATMRNVPITPEISKPWAKRDAEYYKLRQSAAQ